MKKLLLLIFDFLLLTSNFLFAGGLSTTCSSISVENLKIGLTYSLQQLLGQPFSVTYSGKSNTSANLKISLQIPHKAQNQEPQTEHQANSTYQPIPDLNWLKIIQPEFNLNPGETAQTDIIISIPNDKKYLGKKYIVQIYPQIIPQATAGSSGLVFGLGLLCNLKISISSELPTKKEIKQNKKQWKKFFSKTP